MYGAYLRLLMHRAYLRLLMHTGLTYDYSCMGLTYDYSCTGLTYDYSCMGLVRELAASYLFPLSPYFLLFTPYTLQLLGHGVCTGARCILFLTP